MKRPLFWAALGLIPGLLLAPSLQAAPLPCLVGALLAALLVLPRARTAPMALLAGAFLLGLSLPASIPEGPELKGSVRVLGKVVTRSGRTADLALRTTAQEMGPWEQASGRVRVLFPDPAEHPEAPSPPSPGDLILGMGSAKPLLGDLLPGEPSARWQASLNGTRSFVRLDRWGLIGEQEPPRELFAGTRNTALLKALAVGDRSGLSDEIKALFQGTGTSHLLSISGLHVGLVSGAAAWILAWLARPLVLLRPRSHARLFGALGAIIAALAYGELAGWPVSAARSVVMAVLGALALASSRGRDPWHLLGGAAVLLAFWDPSAIATAGWQLSFGAIAGLLLILPRFMRLVPPDQPPFTRWLLGSVLGTSAATLGTLPAQAFYFQSIPLFSVPANLVAIPAVGAIATPAALIGAFVPGFPGWLASMVADLVLSGTLYWLELMEGPLLRPAVGPAGALLLLVAVWLPRHAGVSLCLASIALFLREVPSGRLVLDFLSVGQGDSILVEHPDGVRWLVDGGPSEGRVSAWLRRRGVYELDVVVLTHPHPDHYIGLGDIARDMPSRELWIPRRPLPSEGDFIQILKDFERQGTRVCLAGECGMPSLHPPPGWLAPKGWEGNNESLVLRIQHGERSFLLSGDIEEEVEELLAPSLSPVDVLKVPHHGSLSSSSPALLGALSPRVAVFQVGTDNRHGHPAPATLAHYAGIKVFRTDRDGTVEISTNGLDLRARTWTPEQGWRERSLEPQDPLFSTGGGSSLPAASTVAASSPLVSVSSLRKR